MPRKEGPSDREIRAARELDHLMRTRGNDPTAPIPQAYNNLIRAQQARERGSRSSEIVVGLVGLGAATLLVSFGGSRAEAATPHHGTGPAERPGIVSTANIPEKPATLLVNLTPPKSR